MSSAASAADAGDVSAVAREPQLLAAVVPLVAAWAVDRTFDYAVPEKLAGSVAVGSLVRVPFGGRKVRGVVTEVSRRVPDRDMEGITNVSFPYPIAPAPLPELYEWIALRYASPRARAYERAGPPRVRVPKAEITSPQQVPVPTSYLSEYERGPDLLASISGGGSGSWCVRAHPTHPRGELIAELVSAAGAADGGAALVAVPEVRYGSVVLAGLAAAFPSLVRVDTSTDDMERSVAWAALAAGHWLAAGGRAVVFAPSPQLRLVVIDEEHDSVYKEDRSPRYDARRVAQERARLQGAVCVFISGTPSVETGSAVADGRIAEVAPPRAAQRDARPLVEVVAPPEDGGLSPELYARLRDVLRNGASAALLVPAPGYARTLWCANCRRSLRCPRCEAGLSFELDPRRVRCRRCGFREKPPDTCPSCGASDFRYLGRGSERYAEQLAKAFPRSPVVHMDRRTAEASGGGAVWRGPGIYVTTWFGTKPELRPPVSLVGVLDADALTRRMEFRAAEQAHQVLMEMAQWAGPAAAGGRVVIQTSEPGHHAIQAVVRGSYGFFLERELEQRRELSYPPFSELITVAAVGERQREVIEEAAAVGRRHGARVLGPIAAPYPSGGRDGSHGGDEGLQLLLKCPSAQPVALDLRDILPRVPRGTRLRVDVDPR